jgi:hypothetical protein
MRAPFNQISPEVGVSNPATSRNVVVLPQPDGPSREKNVPRGIASETSRTAQCPGNCFDTRRNSRMAFIYDGRSLLRHIIDEAARTLPASGSDCRNLLP